MLGVRKERKISGNDFLILNQQFNTLIKAGLPILKALDLLATRATAPKLRPILTQVRDRVREGKSLSEAIEEAGVFSKVYSTAILAGEKSGNLSGVLDYYISYQKVSTGVKKKIVASLVYPILLVVVAACIVTYLVTGVIPKFATLYKDLGVPLPGPTQFLIAITVDYRVYILSALGAFLLGIVGVFFWSRSEEGGVAWITCRSNEPTTPLSLGTSPDSHKRSGLFLSLIPESSTVRRPPSVLDECEDFCHGDHARRLPHSSGIQLIAPYALDVLRPVPQARASFIYSFIIASTARPSGPYGLASVSVSSKWL